MSFRYAHAGTYRCDEKGCKAKELSQSGDLPDGWTIRVIEEQDGDVTITDWQHRCPSCSAKVAA